MSKVDTVSEPGATSVVEWVKIVCRGVGQVMFQDHAITGLLFLIGIAYADLWMGLGALIGAVVGPLVAKLLRYDEGQIRDGIYGFNSSLVGIAAFFFFQKGPGEIILLIIACAVSVPVTWAMRKFLPFPTYTLPFIVTTWVMIAVGQKLMGLPGVEHPPSPNPLNITTAIAEGLSEVFLQASLVTGILFFLGLLAINWRHALLGLAGSIIGTLVGIYHSDPESSISIGIFGYNGTLAAIALYLWRPGLLIPLLGAIVSTPITEYFPKTGLATLTAPFVIACWIVIAIGAVEPYFENKSIDKMLPDLSRFK
jgi:urea transporter